MALNLGDTSVGNAARGRWAAPTAEPVAAADFTDQSTRPFEALRLSPTGPASVARPGSPRKAAPSKVVEVDALVGVKERYINIYGTNIFHRSLSKLGTAENIFPLLMGYYWDTTTTNWRSRTVLGCRINVIYGTSCLRKSLIPKRLMGGEDEMLHISVSGESFPGGRTLSGEDARAAEFGCLLQCWLVPIPPILTGPLDIGSVRAPGTCQRCYWHWVRSSPSTSWPARLQGKGGKSQEVYMALLLVFRPIGQMMCYATVERDISN
eukprot:284815090_3